MSYGETRAAMVAPVGSALAHVLLTMSAFAVKAARAIEHRRALRQLGQLDDHMLRDIGLTRSDIRDAASEPLWRDGTQVLIARTVERRAAFRLRLRSRPEI